MIYGYEGNPPEWDYNYKEREQAEEQEENIHYQQLTNEVEDETQETYRRNTAKNQDYAFCLCRTHGGKRFVQYYT